MGTPKTRSVLKAFTVLQSFERPDEQLTCAELSRRANLPNKSGYRLIQTLEEIGAVVRCPHGCYRPGMLLLSLSNNVAIGGLLRDTASDILRDISIRLNAVVHIGLLENGMVTYVAKATSSSLPVPTKVGSQQEAYCSSLGKILLAALENEALDSYMLDGDFIALTPHTIKDRETLQREINRVRILGYATDHQESSLDWRCVAVPIRNAAAATVAAISITVESTRLLNESEIIGARDILVDASSRITGKLFPGPAWKRLRRAPELLHSN